jgi:hypothetical protein
MEAAVSHLRVIDTETGEVRESDLAYQVRDLLDQKAGFERTIAMQAKRIGTLERKVEEDEDPSTHPKGREIVALIERWMRATEHPKSKVSADRVKLVKSRLKDGYTVEQLELAIDGIGAFRYVTNGHRTRDGSPTNRHDRLGIALAGGEKVEEFARLGYQARKEGLVTWGGEE